MTIVLGLFLVVSTFLAGLVTIGQHGAWAVRGRSAPHCASTSALFLVAFRLLTPKQIPWGDMVPGAIAGALGWTLLQYPAGCWWSIRCGTRARSTAPSRWCSA